MVSTHVSARLPRFTRILASLCALSVWLLGVLAVSPELHGHVHSDSMAAHHECAVTLFQHGVENPAGTVDLTVGPAPVAGAALVLPEFRLCTAADVRLNHGRGPPRR
jgi:hypothetical protein